MEKKQPTEAKPTQTTTTASMICPITGDVMKDPVIDPEGNSYEREAIESWLQRNQTSPVSRAPLQISDLRPNRG